MILALFQSLFNIEIRRYLKIYSPIPAFSDAAHHAIWSFRNYFANIKLRNVVVYVRIVHGCRHCQVPYHQKFSAHCANTQNAHNTHTLTYTLGPTFTKMPQLYWTNTIFWEQPQRQQPVQSTVLLFIQQSWTNPQCLKEYVHRIYLIYKCIGIWRRDYLGFWFIC